MSSITITSDSYSVTLSNVFWDSESGNLDKSIEVLDFWDDSFDVLDKGISREPLQISGYEVLDDENASICFPICFPLCFTDGGCSKFETIMEIQDAHEEVTIS